MIGMFGNFRCHEKPSINPVYHTRYSSISPSRSSSEDNGRRTRPRRTAGMSRTLCGGGLEFGELGCVEPPSVRPRRAARKVNKASCCAGGNDSTAASISVNESMITILTTLHGRGKFETPAAPLHHTTACSDLPAEYNAHSTRHAVRPPFPPRKYHSGNYRRRSPAQRDTSTGSAF